MKSLNICEIFFCAHCYRYIFAIEKHYHYPECQNKPIEDALDEEDKYQLGIQKLSLLVQLGEYTKCKENAIREMYQSITKNKELPIITQQPARTYYSLS
jgi:hypothetical protein